MAFTSYRARFQGELAGIKVSDLLNLDFNLETIEERMNFIECKLKEVGAYYDEYFNVKEKDKYDTEEFDNLEQNKRIYYNYSPNTSDELSEDINICKYLEMYANYILNSKDIPREKQQQYKILTEQAFKTILKREQLLSSISNEDNDSDVAVEDIILDTRPANDYTNLDLVIKESDLDVTKQNNAYGIRNKDIYLAKVLNDYKVTYDYLREMMSRAKAGEKTQIPLNKIIQLTSGIKRDMLDSKNMILGIRCKAKRLGDEKPMNDMSTIDYTNPDHVKVILKNCTFGNVEPDNEMTHMAYDMEVAIINLFKNGTFDDIDIKAVQMYNQGYTHKDIALGIEREEKTTRQRLDKIFRKIAEYQEIGEMASKIKKVLKK